MQALRGQDQVYIRGLRRDIVVGRDAWGRSGKEQPVIINARIYTRNAVKDAAETDDITRGIDYSKLCKALGSLMTNCEGLDDLAERIASNIPHYDNISLEITLPRGVPHSTKGITYMSEFLLENNTFTATRAWTLHSATVRIPAIECSCIVGVHPHERENKQPVSISLFFSTIGSTTYYSDGVLDCYQEMAQAVFQYVESSQSLTVEAVAERVAAVVMKDFSVDSVTVGMDKPAAIPSIESPGVLITRERGFY